MRAAAAPSGARRAIELLDQVGIPEPADAARALPAPDVRRHEPARDDRHGDRLQSEAADRRRADHGARRHHPGADPRPAAPAAARARHGAGPDHPRHGRGGRDGRSGSSSCMPASRSRSSRRRQPVRAPAPSLYRGPARGAAGARVGRRRLAPSPASCPACSTGPTGCLFSPRCGFADERCRRRCRPSSPARRAAEQVRCLKPARTSAAARGRPEAAA